MNKHVPNHNSFESRILAKEHLTPHIVLVRIETPATFTFRAGQYLGISVPQGGAYVQRPISIASAPTDKGFVELMIKLMPSGAGWSSYFREASVGSPLLVEGPRGAFVVEGGHPLHFIAAGVGVAPVRAMYRDLLARDYAYPMRLSLLREPGAWGAFDAELAESYRLCKNFSYSFIHASPELASPQWGWRHLTIGLPEHGEMVYLSGSKEFVAKLTETLLARGYAPERLVSENI